MFPVLSYLAQWSGLLQTRIPMSQERRELAGARASQSGRYILRRLALWVGWRSEVAGRFRWG